jgi:ribonuclease HI
VCPFARIPADLYAGLYPNHDYRAGPTAPLPVSIFPADPLAPVARLQILAPMPAVHVTIFTDGGCQPNPGPGGWATILKSGPHTKTLSGGCRRTTNNRMELRAVIEGLRALRKPGLMVRIVSDSRYVTESISRRWLERWAANRFRKADGLRENADLWLEVRELMQTHKVSTQWIRGHAGHPENERCDRLATAARAAGALSIDEGFERARGLAPPSFLPSVGAPARTGWRHANFPME